jgi:hypothetical protein
MANILRFVIPSRARNLVCNKTRYKEKPEIPRTARNDTKQSALIRLPFGAPSSEGGRNPRLKIENPKGSALEYEFFGV